MRCSLRRFERAFRDMPSYPLDCLSGMRYRCDKRELARPRFLMEALYRERSR